MALSGATCQPDYQPPSFLVPMRCAETREGGNEINPAVVMDRTGQRFNVVRTCDDSKRITEPLDDGTAYKYASFDRILGPARNLPGDGCQQAVLCFDGFVPNILPHQAS